MSILFEPMHLGNLVVKNRLVHSAVFESMATEEGKVTDDLIGFYRKPARGEAGLIISGHMYVHPLGNGSRYQTGIHNDDMIQGLSRVAAAVHEEGGTIVFQLSHAGRQTKKGVIGRTPLAPSAKGRDPTFFVKPVAMTQEQIGEVIRAFGQAARRAVEAGADGAQVHAAHGYLINEFLSPFWNQRQDAWGGSDENRFRFLKEVVLEVKKALPDGMPLLVKLNTHDHTPRDGIVPTLAATYARWLAELGIDGLELSCGSPYYCFAEMCRGEVPVDDLQAIFPAWMRPLARLSLKQMVGKFDLEEGYNVPAAQRIRAEIGGLPLMAVGGLRRVSHMEELLTAGTVDLISMARPFIREPALARRFRQGNIEAASCTSCNKCFALIAADRPVRCTQRGTDA